MDWLIRSRNPGNPRWQVNLANCDEAHARSVLSQLERDDSVPSDLELLPIGEAEVTEPPPLAKRQGLLGLLRG